MKKALLLSLAVATACTAMAMPKAIYVKQNGIYTKYNFGVAGDLKFSDGGKTLKITGYSEAIDLDKVEYITFDAPIDDLALTPSEQKNKMVEIGDKVNSMVDLNDNSELLRMSYEFFGSGYWDEVKDEWQGSPSDFGVPQEYWDVHNTAKKIIKSAVLMAKGNPAGARVFKSKAVDLYKLSDYFGIYTANYDKQEWEKTGDAGYLEIRFKAKDNGTYRVKLECSDDYSTWNTKDFNGQLPCKMTVTFAKDNTTLATGTIDSKLVQDQSIDLTLHYEANGYVVDNPMKVTDTGIDDEATVTIKGKYLCKAVCHIDGKNLVNYDVVYDAIKAADDYYDEATDDWVDADFHPLMALFIRGNADVDVIGELQAKGKLFGISKIYDALQEDSYLGEYYTEAGHTWTEGKVERTSGNEIWVVRDDKGKVDNHSLYLNNYSDVSFYYDKDPQLQGFLAWDLDEDADYWDAWYNDYDGVVTNGYVVVDGYLLSVYRDIERVWDESTYEYKTVVGKWHYSLYDDDWNETVVEVNDNDVIFPEVLHSTSYETMPILVFPDMTSFSLEDFFDEDSFSRLIDDYNDVIDTYLDITGQEKD